MDAKKTNRYAVSLDPSVKKVIRRIQERLAKTTGARLSDATIVTMGVSALAKQEGISR